MRSVTRGLWFGALAAAVLAIAAADGLAGKPGGGGEAVPPGRIHCYDATGYWSMNADGTGRVAGWSGEPSRLLHADASGVARRWYLSTKQVAGTYPPEGRDQVSNPRSEVFATREDGTVSVQLTNDPYARPLYVRWGAADAFVSFNATVWVNGSATDCRSEIVRASVGFDSAGVPALTAAPTTAITGGIAQVGAYNHPLLRQFDWSSAGNLVHQDYSYNLHVTTFDGGAVTRFLATGEDPEWAPSGQRIAYTGYSDRNVWTIQQDATGALQVTNTTGTTRDFRPHWSPDSGHLAFTRGTLKGNASAYQPALLRVAATGGSTTTLIKDGGATAWR